MSGHRVRQRGLHAVGLATNAYAYGPPASEIARRLEAEVPMGERVLGQEGDPVFEGWRAQRRILAGLGGVE